VSKVLEYRTSPSDLDIIQAIGVLMELDGDQLNAAKILITAFSHRETWLNGYKGQVEYWKKLQAETGEEVVKARAKK
jgi:hypothetical protein